MTKKKPAAKKPQKNKAGLAEEGEDIAKDNKVPKKSKKTKVP